MSDAQDAYSPCKANSHCCCLFLRGQHIGRSTRFADHKGWQKSLSASMKRKPTASFLSLRTVVTAQNRRRCGNVLSSAYISFNSEKPVNLYNLIKASLSDSNSPNILLTVSLADLHQLMVDTVDATRERLLPLFMKASEDRLLSKEEVAKQLGIGLTSVYNLTKKGKLTAVKVNGATRYRQSEVSAIMDTKKSCR